MPNIDPWRKEFLAGVRTEGVVSMVRQHTISSWGRDPDTKIQKARAGAEEAGASYKSSGELISEGKYLLSAQDKFKQKSTNNCLHLWMDTLHSGFLCWGNIVLSHTFINFTLIQQFIQDIY